MNTEKQNFEGREAYISPRLDVVGVRAEQGFAASVYNDGELNLDSSRPEDSWE